MNSGGGAKMLTNGKLPVKKATLFIALFLIACLTFKANAEANPHGDYSLSTELCAACHITHSADGADLLQAESRKLLCYNCHDGTGSSYNIRSAFGETVLGSSNLVSHHPVPEGTQQCTDCHNPHLTPQDKPRLLSIGPSQLSSGNQTCGYCHGEGSSNPGGNILTPITGTPHDVAVTNPSSGTQIKCARCHQPHGSPYKPLLQQNIKDQSGVSQVVSGNNNTVCSACHQDGVGNYKGISVYNAVKHGSTSSSTVALAVYPGTSYAPGTA